MKNAHAKKGLADLLFIAKVVGWLNDMQRLCVSCVCPPCRPSCVRRWRWPWALTPTREGWTSACTHSQVQHTRTPAHTCHARTHALCQQQHHRAVLSSRSLRPQHSKVHALQPVPLQTSRAVQPHWCTQLNSTRSMQVANAGCAIWTCQGECLAVLERS